MTGAQDIIRNGLAQTDFDGGGHKLVNWDTTNLVFGQFGAQLANRIYAGPASGAAAIPTFRIITASEVGAQPHSAGLDKLSPLDPSVVGLAVLEAPTPNFSSYTKIHVFSEEIVGVEYFTGSQLRTDIQAQPLAGTLTKLALLDPTFSGMALLEIPDAITPGYIKHNGADAGQPWSYLTAEQLLADIGGSSGGGAGGTGTGDLLAITAQGETTLNPGSDYIQWTQPVTIDGTDYVHELIVSRENAAKGAHFYIILDFLSAATAEITVWDGADDPDILQILDISGQVDAATRYVFEAYFNGNNWLPLRGNYT